VVKVDQSFKRMMNDQIQYVKLNAIKHNTSDSIQRHEKRPIPFMNYDEYVHSYHVFTSKL